MPIQQSLSCITGPHFHMLLMPSQLPTPAASHNSEGLCCDCNLVFLSDEAPVNGFIQENKIIKLVVLESKLYSDVEDRLEGGGLEAERMVRGQLQEQS